MARLERREAGREGETRTRVKMRKLDSEVTRTQGKRTVLRREFAVGSELVQQLVDSTGVSRSKTFPSS